MQARKKEIKKKVKGERGVCSHWRVVKCDSLLGVWWMSQRGELAQDMGALWPAHCSRVAAALHWGFSPASALHCHLPEHYGCQGSSVVSLKIHDKWRTRGKSRGFSVMGYDLWKKKRKVHCTLFPEPLRVKELILFFSILSVWLLKIWAKLMFRGSKIWSHINILVSQKNCFYDVTDLIAISLPMNE